MRRNFTQSSYSDSWLEENMVHQVISPKVTKITLEIAKQLVIDRNTAMANVIGVKVGVFVIVNNAMSISSEAKKYYKLREAYENIKCIAMLVDNYTALIIGNLVFTVNKPIVPTVLFRDKEKAIQWLKEYEFLN